MDYYFVRRELFKFVYNNKEINLSQKQQAMNYLLIGIYKNKILEYLSINNICIEEIKDKFLNDVIIKIKK
jgi:hypothetical protein